VTSFVSYISFSWVEISLHVEFHPSRLRKTALTLLNPM
jgi:hypothetical protein